MKLSPDFCYALGEPRATAIFRAESTDFIVDEDLGFTPEGEGEHLFLHIKKVGENTIWVAEKLAKFFAVKPFDVGYAGMKDRNAVTTQWFSIYLPKFDDAAVEWETFGASIDAHIDLLQRGRHKQKLRRGMHRGNHFVIHLRDIAENTELNERLASIAQRGVPNYFGEQRFGREGNNLDEVARWVDTGRLPKSKNKKSIILSSARSFLFNQVLSARVRSETWTTCLPGESVIDHSPSAPLWGRGRSLTDGVCGELEAEVLQPFAALCERLEHCGLSQERRKLILKPVNFSWEFSTDKLMLRFFLEPGAYATSVLREIAKLTNFHS